MSTYTWEGKTYTLPKFDLEKSIASAIEVRKAKGVFREDYPNESCARCRAVVAPLPARCWATVVPGFKMSGLDAHFCGVPDTHAVEVYVPPKPKVYATHVILVQGSPVFVSDADHATYYDKAKLGRFPFVLQGCIFDKVYPTIPYSEWADAERRRGRDVDSHKVIG